VRAAATSALVTAAAMTIVRSMVLSPLRPSTRSNANAGG
jgi:hypothetical protein